MRAAKADDNQHAASDGGVASLGWGAPYNRTLAACIELARAERALDRAKRQADTEMIKAATQRVTRAEIALRNIQ